MDIKIEVEGELHSLHRRQLSNWGYFNAVLSGRWDEDVHRLPLSKDDFLAWKSLLDDKNVAYSSVRHVVDFMLPTDDDYLLPIYTDEEMTQDERMAHYAAVGRLVRRSSLERAYAPDKRGFNRLGKPYLYETRGVHANFDIYYDPVVTTGLFWTHDDYAKLRSQLPPGYREREAKILLDVEWLNLLVGIVHDTWLRTQVEGLTLARSEEVPWWLVRWQDVALVNRPNRLVEYIESVSYRVDPAKLRNNLTNLVIDNSAVYQPRVSLTDLVIGDVPFHQPRGLLTATQASIAAALTGVDVSHLAHTSHIDEAPTMKLKMVDDQGRTIITTGHKTSDSKLVELFGIMLKSIPHKSLVDWAKVLYAPILAIPYEGPSTHEVEKLHPSQLLGRVMANVWRRGQATYRISMSSRLYTKEGPIATDEIPLAARYSLDTLGEELTLLIAEHLMTIAQDRDGMALSRAIKFSEVVMSEARGQALSRLP